MTAPVEPKKGKGFLHKLKKVFGGGEEKPAAAAAPAPVLVKGSGTKTAENQAGQAMDEIARKSALVRNSQTPSRSGKSTDLMGELTDDFHKHQQQAAEAKAKAPEKKAEVWD